MDRRYVIDYLSYGGWGAYKSTRLVICMHLLASGNFTARGVYGCLRRGGKGTAITLPRWIDGHDDLETLMHTLLQTIFY